MAESVGRWRCRAAEEFTERPKKSSGAWRSLRVASSKMVCFSSSLSIFWSSCLVLKSFARFTLGVPISTDLECILEANLSSYIIARPACHTDPVGYRSERLRVMPAARGAAGLHRRRSAPGREALHAWHQQVASLLSKGSQAKGTCALLAREDLF